ncbi:glycoside hydrolase family 19 protein [Streptomyces poriferorum]|uniref:Glycoside hydrolase family 19 protein n=1 Tax=Streptomyces poriferorum TaxID=2798799 RepID=A0ABY9IRH3_9ACTN|nr:MULTISPECIES: glycoside hydrolase family 19 protein [unclassified Streptomyces]MDP5313003.1 glycoside hydrolase family 19 protein [Streptomyces sp. Alt4]WLQ57995.1 glycoside hydrolase family 19 protein [Streptomyces sp. Alt2]
MNRIRSLLAALSAVVATAVFLPVPAHAAPANAVPVGVVPVDPAACAPLWNSSTAYAAGGTVAHHGRNWTAKWWTRDENPGATTVWSDRGACTGGVSDFVISEAEFDEIFPDRDPFYTYQGLIDALHAYPRFANTGTEAMRSREAAAFLTHADFESVGLQYVKEINEANYWIKCDYSQVFGCPAGRSAYYGRGPIMFSWNFNYKAAGDALGLDLLNNPWLVEQDPSVAWQTALWYWNTQNGPGTMTSHDAMVGGAGFGETIRSLNGALECDGGNPASVRARVAKYERITDIIDTRPGSGLTC